MLSSGLTVDSTFDVNYAAIKTAGLIRGAVQLFQPGQDPVAQANLLLTHIGALTSGDLPPVLDLEVNGGKPPATLAFEIQSWVSTVQAATGVTPMIYTSNRFWNLSVQSLSFTGDPLFIAALGVSCPVIPAAWPNWRFWQYSVGAVSGTFVSNLDRFNGTASDLNVLAGIFQAIKISIKPGDEVPTINTKSHGKIPVAILSDTSFDASAAVDISTITFGHTGNEASLAFCGVEDVNGDGIADLLCHFYTQQTRFQIGDTVGVLKGTTLDSVPVKGLGTIQVEK